MQMNLLDEAYSITALWYLAHIDNLRSIFQHGIFSHREIERRGLTHKRIDWPDVQRSRNRPIEHGREVLWLQDKVPLFFATHQPMLYVQRDKRSIAHLLITPAVLEHEGTLFTDGNAASRGSRLFNSLEDLNQLDWHVLGRSDCYWPEWKRKKAAEVLLPSPVSPSLIKRIHVMDAVTRGKIEDLPVPVDVSAYLYWA